MSNMEITCDRCGRTFHKELDRMRFRSGNFYDGQREESYDQICEDCHRELRS